MIDPEARRVVLVMLARGVITMAEAASLAGISRQLLRHWVKVAGVDAKRVRQAVITREWRRLMEERPVQLPSKAKLRKAGERAKAKWDKAHPRPGT